MMEITGTCSSCRCLGKLAGPGRLGDLRSKTCRCQTGSGPAEGRLGECDSLPGPCFYLALVFGKLGRAFGKLGSRRQHRHGGGETMVAMVRRAAVDTDHPVGTLCPQPKLSRRA